MKTSFIGEIKETKQTKAVSLDNVYSIKFVTDDPIVMDLGKEPSDKVFKVTIEDNEQS